MNKNSRNHSVILRGLFALVVACGFSVSADSKLPIESPDGFWRTIDDTTGKPRGIVEVYQSDGKWFARIVRSVTPGEAPRRCTACTDERKDQPFEGLVIMRNVQYGDGEFTGGDILDPNTGQIYRCRFTLEDDGNSMIVRGYVGISLFGRSQRWERMEP